jgi:hypothetical protein
LTGNGPGGAMPNALAMIAMLWSIDALATPYFAATAAREAMMNLVYRREGMKKMERRGDESRRSC